MADAAEITVVDMAAVQLQTVRGAELLLRVVDKTSPDFYANCSLTKRGDVAMVIPYGGAWGSRDRTNPDWRIVQLPQVLYTVAWMTMTPEPNYDPDHPSRTRQPRYYKVDLDQMFSTPEAQRFLADDTRQEPAITLPLSDEAFQALLIQKAPIPDPAVYGPSPTVF